MDATATRPASRGQIADLFSRVYSDRWRVRMLARVNGVSAHELTNPFVEYTDQAEAWIAADDLAAQHVSMLATAVDVVAYDTDRTLEEVFEDVRGYALPEDEATPHGMAAAAGVIAVFAFALGLAAGLYLLPFLHP